MEINGQVANVVKKLLNALNVTFVSMSDEDFRDVHTVVFKSADQLVLVRSGIDKSSYLSRALKKTTITFFSVTQNIGVLLFFSIRYQEHVKNVISIELLLFRTLFLSLSFFNDFYFYALEKVVIYTHFLAFHGSASTF